MRVNSLQKFWKTTVAMNEEVGEKSNNITRFQEIVFLS